MLSAVVVAYRNGCELLTCCEALALAPEIEHIVVVDNSHHEGHPPLAGCSPILASKLVQVLPNSNLGYAAGNNLGVLRASQLGATLILVCNPDVIVRANAVAGLIGEIATFKLDLISPFLVEWDDDGLLHELRSPGWDRARGRGMIGTARDNTSAIVPTFFGACFVAKVELFDRVGPLSEDLFLYAEEIDYCMRMAERGDCRWQVSHRFSVDHARGTSISPGGSSLLTKSIVAYHHSARSAVIVGRKYWPHRVVGWTVLRASLAAWLLVRGEVASAAAVAKGTRQGWTVHLTRE